MWWLLALEPTSPLETTSWLGSIGSFLLAIPATLLSIWAFHLSREQAREQQRQADETSRTMRAVVDELRAIAETMAARNLHRDTAREQAELSRSGAFSWWDIEEATEPAPAVPEQRPWTTADEEVADEPLPACDDAGPVPGSPPTTGYDQGFGQPVAPAPERRRASARTGEIAPDTLNSLATTLSDLESNAERSSRLSMIRRRRTNVLAAVSAAVALGAFGVGFLNAFL